jgi:hypothetical protein
MTLQQLSPSRRALVGPAWSLALLFGLGNFPVAALAESPRVQFDVPYVVAARDITPTEFGAMYPHDKLIELKLQVSSLLQAGDEGDLRQYLFSIVSAQRTMTVVDYLPKTLHETSVAGNMQVENSKENTASIGVNVSGKYEASPEVGFNSGVGEKKTSCVKYELLPPLESVAASGTVLRGSGVYYKLKATDRNLLEGAREVAMTVRVPKAWRADYLHVHCEADGYARSVVRSLDQVVSCGERDFLVVVYLEGDEQARGIAFETARRETHLRRVAVARQAHGNERSKPSFPKLIALPAPGSRSVVSNEWLSPFIYNGVRPSTSNLSPDVIQAAVDFDAARQELKKLSGWPTSELAAIAGSDPDRR